MPCVPEARRLCAAPAAHAQHVALEYDAPAPREGADGARHFGGVELLVLVRRHRGVEVREQRGDAERVARRVRRREEVRERGVHEARPALGRLDIGLLGV